MGTHTQRSVKQASLSKVEWIMKFSQFAGLAVGGAMTLLSATAFAGPTYTFNLSSGVQPNNVGTITLTQVDSDSVTVNLDLISTVYGVLNTGGPHTPFTFNLASTTGLSIDFISPAGGTYTTGSNGPYTFSLNTSGGSNTPFGSFSVAIDSSAGNGSGKAYYNDLTFTLKRTGGLSTDDFLANSKGAYFAADLTDGKNTGAQAWNDRTKVDEPPPPPTGVPEPLTLSLLGAGLAGMAAFSRRKRKA
ncbi:MAG: PEP-CTERM sorting domain-containing protein [Alphaproteobacteria bacterium]|nr:PEP-CTERM sorting domain-containing protein [Alphaproteobacteria bacterium]